MELAPRTAAPQAPAAHAQSRANRRTPAGLAVGGAALRDHRTRAGRRGAAARRARERPRPVRPGRGDRAARRRLVAADRGPVRVRERRLPVRGRRRHRDLRHQPRAPLRAAGRAGRSSSAAARRACTSRARRPTSRSRSAATPPPSGCCAPGRCSTSATGAPANDPRPTCSAWWRSPRVLAAMPVLEVDRRRLGRSRRRRGRRPRRAAAAQARLGSYGDAASD